MTTYKRESLFTRVEAREQAAQESWGVFVPVDDLAVYEMLAREIGQAMATRAEAHRLLLIVDAATAQTVPAVDDARRAAERVFHFGETVPRTWAETSNLVACAVQQDVGPDDRFLVALSSSMSFALLGAPCPRSPRTPRGFRGGWTGRHGIVERVAETILNANDLAAETAFPAPAGPEHADQAYAHSMRLMTHMAQHLTSRERDIAKDKDDLYSVLNIIDAISSKRHAQNILYVFVEEIARIVEMVRCSVVRVWGQEDKGHVLASHEDAGVRDLVIDLNRYPELHRAMETRSTVVVDDVMHDPLTSPFAKGFRRSGITSLVVIPITLFDPNVGSFFLRAARTNGPFSVREVGFCEVVAKTAGNALERAYLFESIQRVNEQLEFLAVTDGLTGLYNHRFFHERLEEEFERARRYDQALSCLIFDVDDFKQINDTFGHLEGDAILREIALRASQMVRKSDIVARYGGEEFVVIMPQTGLKGGRAQAERIRREIGGRPYPGLPEDKRITVSVGMALLDQSTMTDCEALIRAADSALYDAKRAGKDCVVIQGE